MPDVVLTGKLGIGIVCAALSAILVLLPRLRQVSRSRFDTIAVVGLLASRLGLFVGLYVILGYEVGADVGSYYYPHGLAALEGQIVYRQIETSYAPLFPYVIAGVLFLWNAPTAIIAFAILVELASLPFWLSVSRRLFTERVTRTATILYVCSPIPLVNVAMNGQNQIWQSLLLAIALWLLTRRDLASGVVYGATLAAVKLLGLLFAPVLWLFAKARLRWMLGFALLPGLTYAGCFLIFDLGIDDFLVPLEFQGMHLTAGNLPFLASVLGVDIRDETYLTVWTGVLLLALAVVFLAAWARGAARRPENVIHLITLVLLTVFLFSKKSYPTYLVLSFFAMCLSVSARPIGLRTLVVFGVFSCAAVLEPSILFRWVKPYDFSLIWEEAMPEGRARWKVVALLACDLILIASYVWLFVRTVSAMGRGGRGAHAR